MTAKSTEKLKRHVLVGIMRNRNIPPYCHRVRLDGKPLDPGSSLKVVNHSPDGFNWGYLGSGPAQLAAAIMLELQNDVYKPCHYQDFKDRLIARIPQESFVLEFDFPDLTDAPDCFELKPDFDFGMSLISKHLGVNV